MENLKPELLEMIEEIKAKINIHLNNISIYSDVYKWEVEILVHRENAAFLALKYKSLTLIKAVIDDNAKLENLLTYFDNSLYGIDSVIDGIKWAELTGKIKFVGEDNGEDNR